MKNNNNNNFNFNQFLQFDQLKTAKQTSFWLKFGLALLCGVLPMLTIQIIFGGWTDTNGNWMTANLGLVWLIGIAALFFAAWSSYLLKKISPEIQLDAVFLAINYAAVYLAYFTLFPAGWQFFWILLISILYFIAISFIARVIYLAIIIYKTQNQLRTVFETLKKTNPNKYNEMKDQQANFAKSQKQELDEILKSQGIDIDGLDQQFGSHLDNDANKNIVDVTLEDDDEKK